MMPLDEGIEYCENIAIELEDEVSAYDLTDDYERYMASREEKCASEHRQLAEWLRELKAYRESWEYLFATIFEIKSNAENEDVRNLANFLLKYMRIYEKEIGEVKTNDT